EMVVEVDRNQLPSDLELEVGKQLQVRQQDGQKAVVTVVDVSESSVKLDANHPLAGEELTFDLQLVEII
ncbi:MAG: FKBP-type peptidyl-prolyl cis-trans isomerase, partial [Planctomycetota bacterium]